jgi:hypothetical protein
LREGEDDSFVSSVRKVLELIRTENDLGCEGAGDEAV